MGLERIARPTWAFAALHLSMVHVADATMTRRSHVRRVIEEVGRGRG